MFDEKKKNGVAFCVKIYVNCQSFLNCNYIGNVTTLNILPQKSENISSNHKPDNWHNTTQIIYIYIYHQ